jgi:hypothetical protein
VLPGVRGLRDRRLQLAGRPYSLPYYASSGGLISYGRDTTDPNVLAVTIRPPFEERANAVMARSISSASCTPTGRSSTPKDGNATHGDEVNMIKLFSDESIVDAIQNSLSETERADFAVAYWGKGATQRFGLDKTDKTGSHSAI